MTGSERTTALCWRPLGREIAVHSRFVVCPLHIGRAAELQAVDAAIAAAGDGAGRTVLICGEAGVARAA